jgi:tyrosyl-tRNA synthetase
MKDVVAELRWRGLLHQTTDDENLAAWLLEKPRTVYAGFDPTADSLHVGHLVALTILRRFQQAGHRPIALVGGATGMIGDPSGRSDERNLLTEETIQSNIDSIEPQMRRFLDFNESNDNGALLVNNYDWMKKFGYLEFLRDIGKMFPVNVMLAKDSVKSRLDSESGISYTEFSYMLLQAYDFVQLFDQHGCELQVGGSDQWGNITAGVDLGRRMRSAQLQGATCPLLLNSEGQKMGKTAKGALWLSPDKTSPYQFYQYWINVADADVGRCIKFFSDMEQAECETLLKMHEEAPQKRAAQRLLAEELTRQVHGDDGLVAAERATAIFFGAEISEVSDAQLGSIFADVSSKELSRSVLNEGLLLIDAFVESGLAKSKGEARRTIQQGGAYVNNRRLQDLEIQLTTDDLASETMMVLRSGKKRYAVLRFVD